MGDPGCGLVAAALCDTFDGIASSQGRAGELDAERWSLSRNAPQSPTVMGSAFAIGPATLPSCRPDLPDHVFPDRDALVCNGNDAIGSRHALIAVAAQNYGQTSLRARRPFDFAGRTGKVVFDVDAFTIGTLFGWVSVEITEDPTPVPSFGIYANTEGGSIPRNALEVQIANTCNGYYEGAVIGVDQVHVFDDYVDTLHREPDDPFACVPTAQGHLNHFELEVSQTHVALYGTAASSDGVTFGERVLLYETDVSLPFTRGYVHFTTHNHATLKYSQNDDFGAQEETDAWVTRWDNLGFDGPVVPNTREYELPDALELRDGMMNVGYRLVDVPNVASGGGAGSDLGASHRFAGVDLTGVVRARLVLTAWYLNDAMLDGRALSYRWNGGPWHTHVLTADEVRALTRPVIRTGADTSDGGNLGSIGHALDVPVGEASGLLPRACLVTPHPRLRGARCILPPSESRGVIAHVRKRILRTRTARGERGGWDGGHSNAAHGAVARALARGARPTERCGAADDCRGQARLLLR